jgi:hypothetical protein
MPINDPNKKPIEPQRTSQPNPQEQPMTPMEAPGTPSTEYEKQVPHQGNRPIAHGGGAAMPTSSPRGSSSDAVSRTGKSGEGSYEGTRDYDDGLAKFSKEHSPEESVERGKKIDPNDPELKRAEEAGKRKGMDGQRRSSPSVH